MTTPAPQPSTSPSDVLKQLLPILMSILALLLSATALVNNSTGTAGASGSTSSPAPVSSGSTVASPTLIVSTSPTTRSPSPSASSTAWPNASNTGVPAGTVLKASPGLTISKAGQVVSGLDIKGCVDVEAPNVVIKNSRITGGCTNIVNNGSTGLLVQDVEIVGTSADSQGIGWSDYTAIRVNIHGTGDGARANGNTVIRDSYIHGLVEANGSHNDGVQVTEGSNIRIVHNAIENPNGQTSAVMVGADQGPVSNVTVSNNLLNGGGYALYGGAGGGSIKGIVVTGNQFGTLFWKTCGFYGPTDAVDDPNITYSGNVWAATGLPVG